MDYGLVFPNELIQYIEFLRAEEFFVMPFLGKDYKIIANGRGAIIDDDLRKMWQAEIDKYSGMVQEEVMLEEFTSERSNIHAKKFKNK